jgi:hypothetical protein
MDPQAIAISGVLLMPLVIGIVQFIKKLGWVVNDGPLKLLAVGVAMFFGMLYMACQLWPGTVQYISMVLFVISFGLSATGLFDVAKKLSSIPTTTITTVVKPTAGVLSQTVSRTEPTKDSAIPSTTASNGGE